jgi:protein-S-isoprenylcysteine O-methyltransferase Ste14
MVLFVILFSKERPQKEKPKKKNYRSSIMNRGMIKAIIILPGTVLVFIPAIILLIAKDSNFHHNITTPDQIRFWLALFIAVFGLIFSVWTVKLFRKVGEGTPAPWDPPKEMVIRGPYRHVRNPMITSVLFILFAEAIFFQSWPIALWMLIFFMGNMIYFPLIEEKGLEKRFGDDYRRYKANVPRWVPNLKAWKETNDR